MTESTPQNNDHNIADPVMAEHMAYAMDPHETYIKTIREQEVQGTLRQPYPEHVQGLGVSRVDRVSAEAKYLGNLAAVNAKYEYTPAQKRQQTKPKTRRPAAPDKPKFHLAQGMAIDPETGEERIMIATFDNQTGEQLTGWE